MAATPKPSPSAPAPPNKPPTTTATDLTDPLEGPGKGRAFFERARTVASTNSYDYAIDMYIEGLNREPFNLEEHKALRDTAMRRKIAGGKAAGGILGPKTPYKGKTPKEAMLNAEWVLAKDVGHIPSMMTMARNAALLEFADVTGWIAAMAREANRTSKSPKLEIFTELADLLEKVGQFSAALECMQAAIQLKPNDMELHSRAQKLAARYTIQRGNYEQAEDFKESIKDKEATKDLLQEENLNRSEEYRLKAITTAKADYEKNPREQQVIVKYYKALVDMDDEKHENAAIDMLSKAYADTRVYRYKVAIGDIRMKQLRRNIRMLRDAYLADPADKEMLRQLDQANKERMVYELAEFRERSDNFPTDMHVRYEYAARLYESHHYDEAIVAFQEAQNSPRFRVDSLHLLGRSFLEQKMVPEALDTFKKAIDEYDLASSGNKKSRELYYWYGRALEQNGDFGKAIDVYSQIVRWEIGFRDARKRLEDLRRRQSATPGDGSDGATPKSH